MGVSLSEGKLVVSVTSDGLTTHFDSGSQYNDEAWHYLTVTKKERQ